MKTRFLALATALALTACGGGGTVPYGSSTPTPHPTTGPVSQPQYAKMSLTWKVAPAGTTVTAPTGNRPQYVSPNATQVEVKVNSVNGGAAPSWVTADATTQLVFSGANANCSVSSGTATCNIQVAAPPGNVNYTFSVLDSSNDVLATFTANFTITQGSNNPLAVTLGGVVQSVTVTGPALAANTSQTAAAVTVAAFDASGAEIVGSADYNNPITLTLNDAAGQTKLHLNGGSAATSVTVTSPGDAVTLDYTGQAVNNPTITASGTGISGGGTLTSTVSDVAFSGTTDDTAAHGGVAGDSNWGQQTLFFSQASGSQVVTGSEAGFTNAPYSQQFDLQLDPGCSGIATASASPATAFTITATGVGVCKARLKEHGTGYPITQHTANTAGSETHDGTFWISVTSATITVNSKPHTH